MGLFFGLKRFHTLSAWVWGLQELTQNVVSAVGVAAPGLGLSILTLWEFPQKGDPNLVPYIVGSLL